jgi:predicted RNA-binding protein with TRAM domain
MYGKSRGFGGPRIAPVKVGDELDVEIESVGEKGDGVAKKEGFVLFVPGTQKGDKVKIKVTKVFRKVGFGEVIGKAEETKKQKKSVSEEPAEEPEEPAEEPEEDTEDFGEESNE